MKIIYIMILLIFTFVPSISSAISIDYSLTYLGATSYSYCYTVTNDGSLGAGVPVLLFDIEFNPALYDESSLKTMSSNAITNNWSESILASAPGVPALYDAVAQGNGIPEGTSVSGFTVQFDWLGAVADPGKQNFYIYDPSTFDTLATGTTRGSDNTSSVPEPTTIILCCIGLAFLCFKRYPLIDKLQA